MKYFAVRKPETLKGVYTNEKKIKEIRSKKSGISYKVFLENQKQDALVWAGVKEIADAEQQVVQQNNNKNDMLKDIFKVLQNIKNKEHNRAQDVISLINAYKKMGFTYIVFQLTSGEENGLVLYDFADGKIEYSNWKTEEQSIKDALHWNYVKAYEYASDIEIYGGFLTFNKLWTIDNNNVFDVSNYCSKAINIDNIVSITPYIFKYKSGYGFKKIDVESIELYDTIEPYLD